LRAIAEEVRRDHWLQELRAHPAELEARAIGRWSSRDGEFGRRVAVAGRGEERRRKRNWSSSVMVVFL
jgi:hypothetical protein